MGKLGQVGGLKLDLRITSDWIWKKTLNPKLAQKKITVIEDSSSQEELEDNEDKNEKDMKGKKQMVSENK